MKKKIIFFDADGTIISRQMVTDKTREALEKIRKNGHIAVLSTGRPIPAIEGSLKDFGFEHMIASAGATVVLDNKIVFSKPLIEEDVQTVRDYLHRVGAVFRIETDEKVYVSKGGMDRYMSLFALPEKDSVSPQVYEDLKKVRERVAARSIEEDLDKTYEVKKFQVFLSPVMYGGEEPPVNAQEIIDAFSPKMRVLIGSYGKGFEGVEISDQTMNKSEGMQVVLDYFQADIADTYAIGDDYNDIEMLSFAHVGIAMGHSPKELKDVADYITDDYENEGFYNAMAHYGLI